MQRLADGEVSPYLTDVLMPGDPLELRGPIGGWFVWDPAAAGPVLLVAGGSGVVPLMSMIRARAEAGSRAPFRLVYSVRSPETALYAAELAERARPGDGLERELRVHPQRPARWPGAGGPAQPGGAGRARLDAGRPRPRCSSAGRPASWRPRPACWSRRATIPA